MAEDFQDSDPKGDLVKVAAYIFYAALFSGLGFFSLTAGRGLESQNTLIQYLFFFAPFFSVVLTFSIFKILKFFGLVKDVIIYIHDPELGILGEISRSLPFLKGAVRFLSSPFRLALVSLFLFSTLAFIGTLNQSTIGSFFFPYTIGTVPEQVSSGSIIFFQVYNAPAENAWLYLVVTIMLSGEIMLLKKIKAIAGHARRIAILGLFFINVPAIAYIWLQIHNVVTNNTQQTFAHVFFGMMQGILLFVTGSIIPGEIYHIINNLFDYMNRNMSSLAFTITFSIILAFSFIALIAYASSRKGGLDKKGQSSIFPFLSLFSSIFSLLKFKIKFKKSALKRTAGIIVVLLLLSVVMVSSGEDKAYDKVIEKNEGVIQNGSAGFIDFDKGKIEIDKLNATSGEDLKLEVTNKLKDKQDYTFAIQIDELRDVYFDKKNGTELINKSVYNISTEVTILPNGTQEYSYVIVNLTNISILTDKWVKADTFIFSYDSKTWLGTTFNSDLNSITDFKINAKTKVFGAKVNYDYMLNTTSKDDILKKETETYIILDPTLDDNLVGYWDMSGVSNMTTDIFGTNDGALSGTTSFRGTSNPISETGGGQYLSLSAGALGTGGFFTISDATNQLVAFDDKIYTLSYWINTTDISGRMVTHAITSAGLGTQCWAQNPFLIEMGASSSVMYRGFTGVRNHINFPGNLSDNKWHNVILTSNATGGFLYIDGKSTGSMPLDTGGCVESSGWNLTFGCNAGADAPNTTQCAGAAPDMDMRLDEVGLWSRGFTQSDASSLYYNGTNGTFCSGDPCSYAVSEESPSPEVLGRPVITLPAADVANSTNNFKVTNVSINHSVAMWLNNVYKGNFTINSTFNFSGVPQEQMLNFTAASWNGSAYGLNESINFTHDNYTATSSYVPYSVANASFINVSYVLINISVNETFNHTFTIHNGTTNWINVNAGGSGSSKYFFYNFTGLTDGNYTFFASVNDTAGNRVVTLNRTVIVDTVAPAISFVANTPANNSYLPRSNIFINTTHNDAGSDHNDYSAFVDFNNSLVGYWRFEDDGDTNATDFSSYGNNGTLVNFGCMGLDCNASSGWVSNGKRGKAVIVDGANDYVDLGNTSLRLLNWTYEFWIKRNTDSGTDEFHLSKSNSTDYDNFLYFTTPDTFICRWTDTAGSDHWATTVSTFTATNTWYYIACTYDSTNVKIYVNGNLDVTSTDFSAFTPRVSSVPLWLGRRANTYTGNRTFDEVKAWNRALSAQEINASFNAGIYRLERNFTGLSDGNYSYRAFVVDAAGNINSTANQTFVTDATFPLINFTANTHLNNTFTNQNWTFINISYSELYGGVFKIHNGTTDTTPNIIAGSFNYNFTNLPDGNYSYFATINDSAGNKNVTKNLTIVVDTLIPSVSGSNFLTTGKISTSPLLLGQTIDWIAATASDLYLMQVNITITGGDGTTPVNNVLMTNDYGSNWNYTSDLTLNSAGNWTVNIKGIDRAGNTFTNSTNFTVNTQNKSTTEGLYGYTDNKVFSTAEITSLSTYKYELLEFSENISNMAGSWGTILAGINESKITSAVVGLNYILDINYSKPSDVTNAMLNISKYFPEIKNSPYITTVQYVSFQIVNDSSYNDSDKYNALNNLAQNATNAFLNQFAIYSKNYNSSNLSTSYIKFTPLLYVTSTTQSDLVTAENNLLRQNRSINRVYVNLSTTLKTQAKSYQDNVIAILRGTPALNANLGNVTIAEIDTAVNDLVVFNNESIDKDMSINASNITGLIGKDVWDATSKKLIANNTNGVFNVNASAYSAVVLYTEDIDHIQLSSLISGKVFKGGINTIKSLNHTDGTRDNNFALDGAKDARITLDNPHYIWNDFRVDYGWLNASPINYSTASPYDLVIFADKNDQEIDKLNFTASDFYHYLSDASYTNSQAWYDSQKAVIDEYFAFNSNIAGSFLNGLDAAMAGANFTSWLQDQVDDVKIARAKKVILNTYTYSENLSTIGDFVMKESCINRWNGADSANPTSYTREDFSLEINKSTFYQNHNIPVLCQAFMNLSSFNQIDNATDMLNIYYGAKVLYGRNAKFNVDKPTFNGVQPIKVPDLGNDLANAPSTDDNVTYYRAFSNGIVYYNSSSTQGRFDDGKEVSSAKLCFDLYDNHATSVTVQFTINREVTGTDAGDYNFSDSELDGVGVWTRKCVELNETHRNLPRYDVQVFVTPRTTIIGQGVAIGNDYILTENKYSWHDSSTSPNVWTLYGMGTNWNVNLEINQTQKASIDTVSTITQTEVNSSKHYNLTLSSGFPVNTEVWSNPQTIARTDFINLTYFDGTNYQLLYPSNVSNCDSNNPSWNTTTIGGNPFKSCIETNGSAYTIRVAPYKLSDQLFVTEFLGNTAPEAPTIIFPSNATITNFNRINYSSSDAEGDSITFRIYINGTFNGTAVDANFTFQSSPEKSLAFNVSACDASLCSVNTTGYFMYDNLTPRVNYSMNSDTNNSFKNVNWAFLNFSWADVNNDTVWIIRDGINVTVNMTSTYFFANITGLADGLHVFAGWMNDTAGNVNQTLNTTITIDMAFPRLSYGLNSDANNSFVNRNWVFLNFSWNETRNDTFTIHNGTTNWLNVNATSSYFFYNFTNVPDGNFTFFASLNDTAGNRNLTLNRTIVVDVTSPNVNLTLPTNNSAIVLTGNALNFSVSDLYLNNSWYKLVDKYDGSVEIDNLSLSNFANTTFNILNYHSFTLTLFVNDKSGNVNSTSVELITNAPSAPANGGADNKGSGGGGGSGSGLTVDLMCEELKSILELRKGLLLESDFVFVQERIYANTSKNVSLDLLKNAVFDFKLYCPHLTLDYGGDNVLKDFLSTAANVTQNVTIFKRVNDSLIIPSAGISVPLFRSVPLAFLILPADINVGMPSEGWTSLLRFFFSLEYADFEQTSVVVTGTQLWVYVVLGLALVGLFVTNKVKRGSYTKFSKKQKRSISEIVGKKVGAMRNSNSAR